MDTNPAFLASLKLSNPERFGFLGWLITSSLPVGTPRSEDQVIGFWYLDREYCTAGRLPFFKQDFVVNVGSSSSTFVSYVDAATLRRVGPSLSVRLIDEFFRDYGDGSRFFYCRPASPGVRPWAHHYNDVSDLPEELRSAGERLKNACLGQ